MTTISGTLTAEGVSTVLVLGNAVENVDLTVTGPFDGTVALERDLGGQLAWEAVRSYTDASATITTRYVSRANDRLRVRLRDTAANLVAPLTTEASWTAGTGWALSEGTATRTASAATPNLTATLTGCVAGASYAITFAMTTSAGSLTVDLGGGTASDAQTESDGSVTVTIVAGSTNTTLRFIADATYAGTVTSVVVTPSIAYSFADGDAIVDEYKDRDGNVLATRTQAGMTEHGWFAVDGAATVGGNLTVTGTIAAAADVQTITAADAINLAARHVKITGPATSTYAVTLAAPTVGGIVKVIEMVATTSTNAVTLALTNVVGGSAATTATFNAAGEILTLVSAGSKWVVLDELGVTLA